MGLNDPVIVQWMRYIGNAVTGDFGESYVFKNREFLNFLFQN
ncbi:MAG: hypothetical protein Ct9H90mP2_13560 [Dehalococcoidia bacterium]|nr:MAG: hypothetical protein Ct9H90mP2_13560 [Dehalococcoidia bacterium]